MEPRLQKSWRHYQKGLLAYDLCILYPWIGKTNQRNVFCSEGYFHSIQDNIHASTCMYVLFEEPK